MVLHSAYGLSICYDLQRQPDVSHATRDAPQHAVDYLYSNKFCVLIYTVSILRPRDPRRAQKTGPRTVGYGCVSHDHNQIVDVSRTDITQAAM